MVFLFSNCTIRNQRTDFCDSKKSPPLPIRIGALYSLTGTMAISETPLLDAIRLATEEINATGGIMGQPIKLVVADGRSDWGFSAMEAERLITQEKVSTIFACLQRTLDQR